MNTLTRESVTEAEDRLLAAMLAGDADTLDTLIDDALICTGPDGSRLTKQADLEAHRTRAMILERADRTIDEISLYGDVAVCLVTMHAKGTMMGAPLEGDFRYLRVWKQTSGELRIISVSIQTLNSA